MTEEFRKLIRKLQTGEISCGTDCPAINFCKAKKEEPTGSAKILSCTKKCAKALDLIEEELSKI